MKKCSYCGKEYTDNFVSCITDGEALLPVGAQSVPVAVALPSEMAVGCGIQGSTESQPVAVKKLSERQLMIAETVIVCLVAFGGSILTALYDFRYGFIGGGRSEYYWISSLLRQGSLLAMVWYLLARRGKSFADFGMDWGAKDFGISILLRVAGSLAYYGVKWVANHAALVTIQPHSPNGNIGQDLFGNHVTPLAMIAMFVNPFFEELIVRAYLMTQIRELTGSVGKAILISVVLQSAYHLYQGAPAAIGHAAGFLIYSLYFAKTKRIAPIILAHLYVDVGSTLLYFLRHAPAFAH